MLSRLGYAQELLRAMGGFSSFAISFSIISILTGIMTTYAVALGGGGPAALGYGWPIVSVGTLIVAMAMGELASAFPTAGALYHWSALLGGPGWGWFTAMMNLAGQCAIVAAIDLGCAQAIAGTLRLPPSANVPLLFAVLLSHGLINAFSVKLVAWLNSFSATVHIVGVIIIVGALVLWGRAQPVSFLGKTGFTLREDGNYTLGFLNALVLGMWTFTGYDASAHVSEETHDPARRAPWGIVSSVAVSAVAGYALIAGLTLAIVDLPATANDKEPPLYILRHAFGETTGDLTMGLAVVAMWFCGLSSVTSASRMLFAFCRDGGLPGSATLRRVSPSHKTPLFAILASTLGPFLLVLLTLPFSDKVFLAVASLATTGLYLSYAMPIALGIHARATGKWRHRGPWNLRGLGIPMAACAVAWSLAVLVICCLPPNWNAAVMLGSVVVVILALYFVFARTRFAGPQVSIVGIEASFDARSQSDHS
ncbi:amino acid permease [Pendulispora rubella]|uniref:Amino acid permease n=1 Tax=Pendulispora rubella TaxID=2741070 RepID=A0ABZ2LD81_9BACT